MDNNTDPRIPTQWRNFWEPVKTPPALLVHFTTPDCAEKIMRSGYIKPMDPAPRDWEGLHAVFMCDPEDATFGQRFRSLLSEHFFARSRIIDVFEIKPEGQLYRCTVPFKRSYYISLDQVTTDRCLSHRPFIFSACLSDTRTRTQAENAVLSREIAWNLDWPLQLA